MVISPRGLVIALTDQDPDQGPLTSDTDRPDPARRHAQLTIADR